MAGSGPDDTAGPGPDDTAGSGPDPLGKRALFWMPADAVPDPDPAGPSAAPLGKRALYSDAGPPGGVPAAGADEAVVGSNPVNEHGRITVTCSTCGVVSRIGLLDFAIYQLPVGFWLPRGRFGHRMTCPACRRRVWAGVTLR